MGSVEEQFGVLVICVIILAYIILQSFMEHVHFHYIHETGIGIILGVIFGSIIYFKEDVVVSFN
jgi:uncharacterized membrane protein YadS